MLCTKYIEANDGEREALRYVVCIVNIKGMVIDYVRRGERAACCHNDVHGKYVKKYFFFTIISE
jgi:hypothetical protein